MVLAGSPWSWTILEVAVQEVAKKLGLKRAKRGQMLGPCLSYLPHNTWDQQVSGK